MYLYYIKISEQYQIIGVTYLAFFKQKMWELQENHKIYMYTL